jgi:hypothetical protein
MPLSPTHRLLLACALSAAFWTHALAQTQAAPKAGRADPMNPQAEVPPLSHVSALAAYRAAGDGKVGNWQEANQTVTRIGGWRAYAREAAAPAPASAAPGAAPAPAVPAAAAAASRSPAPHPGHGQP